MADDPFAGYSPPSSSSADPFAGYAPPKPTDPEDIMLQHMASWLPGAAYLHNLTRVGETAATSGLSNRLDQLFSGNTIQQEAARTEQAKQAIGPYATMAAEAAGSLGGLGGATAGVPVRAFAEAAPLAAGATGGGLGPALAQGAALGAMQGVGSSDDPTQWAVGAGEGALAGGVAQGVASGANALIRGVRGPLAQPADVTASLKATRDAAYDALKTVDVPDASQAVADARSAVDAADPGGALQQNAPRTMTELNRIEKRINASGQTLTGQQAINWLQNQRPNMSNAQYAAAFNQIQKTGGVSFPGTQSAHDILTSLDNLRDYQGPNAGAENDLAPIVEQHLNDALNNAGAGPPLAAAKAAHQDYANAKFLQQAGEGLKYFGQSPVGEAARIAQTYYPSGAADIAAGAQTSAAAAFKSLSDIAKAGGGMPSSWSLAHAAYPLTEGAGAALGSAVGGPAGAMIGEMAGGAAGSAAKTAIGNALSKVQQAATQKAILSGYPALAGQSLTAPNYRQALRTLLLGPATGGL